MQTFTIEVHFSNDDATLDNHPRHAPLLSHKTYLQKDILIKLRGTNGSKKLKVRMKNMVTFSPSDRPSDYFVSCMTQSKSSKTPRTQRGSINFTQRKTDSQNKRVPYVFNVQFHDVLH